MQRRKAAIESPTMWALLDLQGIEHSADIRRAPRDCEYFAGSFGTSDGG